MTSNVEQGSWPRLNASYVKYLLSFKYYEKQGKLCKEISGFYALLIKAAKEFSVYICINQRIWLNWNEMFGQP